MKKIFLKLLCILSIMNLYACQSNTNNIPNKEILEMDKISNNITLEAAKKICTEKDCQFGGYGGFKPDGKVKSLYLSLSYFKPIKIQEARELLVYSTNTFLNKINSSKELRPYLENYPATEKNIELRISVSDNNNQIKPPYISYPAMLKGTCFYYIRNDKGRLELLQKETFAKAEQIVRKANK